MYIYIIYIACLSYLRTHRYNTKQSPGDITLQITATCLPGLEMGSLHTLVSLGLVVLSTTFGACRKFIFVLYCSAVSVSNINLFTQKCGYQPTMYMQVNALYNGTWVIHITAYSYINQTQAPVSLNQMLDDFKYRRP